MQIAHTIAEMRSALRALRTSQPTPAAAPTVGLVPTMGALHDGHRSLLRAARQRCEVVAVSIFVNPTQFGPQEDFSRYPRTFEADCRMLEAERVDLLFAPAPEEMYPAGASTVVRVEGLSDRLDGASRPGHFYGVATVVAKLLHIVQPEVAFFGQKDAAQVAVLRRMVRDLDLPVELAICPIVREADGLAMSSRNRYLSPEERRQALVLSRALQTAEALAQKGERAAAPLLETMRGVFATETAVKVDYLAVVDAETLLPVEEVRAGALVAVAAYVGATRLIDNILLPPAV
ncbi:MAG: pantoate--beta-alanine ligase [Acidobacteriaceae bacterium]